MILVVSTCADRLHDLEFVKPVEDILRKDGVKYVTKHYSEIKDVKDFDYVIICGTSLKDEKFMEDVDKFAWIKSFGKPVLGICAGMQIIGLLFGGKLERQTEIGFYKERLDDFLGLKEEEVYHLHNHYVEFKDFEILSKGKVAQAVRHGNIYGVLFHPEVRQKELIRNFAKL